jgi:hypothetical protein
MNRAVDFSEFKEIEISKIAISHLAMSKRKNSKNDYYYELEESIKAHGLLQPIGVARSKITEDSRDFEWELLWGEKRVNVFKRLNRKKIPARVIDRVLSEQEIEEYRQLGYVKNFSLKKNDIWNIIKEPYLIHGNEKIVAEMTGIPLKLVRDTIFSKSVERTVGGQDLMSYCRDIGTPNNVSKKIFHIVYNHENQSVDLLKGKELANLLSSVDQNLINKIVKSANAHPLGSIKDWVADARELKNNKKSEVGLDIELIEEEDYGLFKMAAANGLTVNEMIRKILKEKLVKEGLLEEE